MSKSEMFIPKKPRLLTCRVQSQYFEVIYHNAPNDVCVK